MSSPSVIDPTPSRAARTATFLGLAALIWAAFGGVLANGWIFFDDHEYVTHNPRVRAGFTWEGFTWFLHEFHVANWHPLTSWSHMLDVELFGLEPRGPHAVNLALHTLNALLLVHVLFRYTGQWWPSACVAALFALHPLRVESVAWIAERKDVLSGLFFVLTLWAWRRWLEQRGALRYGLAVAAFVLGLMSKPMLLTLPFVLLLLDAWPLRRTGPIGERVIEKWPLFAITVVFVVVTFVAQSTSGATAGLQEITTAQRASTALTAYARYLGETFAPIGLAPIYPYEHAIEPLFPLLSLAGIVLVTILLVRARARRPHLMIGWFWFLGMLVPVIGLVQVGPQSHADRYTYLPSIGLALAIVFEVARALARHAAWRVPVGVAFAAVLVALVSLTRAQTSLWHDSRRLFEHTLRVTRDNPTAHKIYGDTMIEAGDFAASLPHFEEALRLAPNLRDGRKNYGCALGKLGRFEEAVEQFRLAVAADPSFENQLNLGWSLCDAGRMAEAIEPLTRALEIDESSAPAHLRLGMALGNQNRMDEALRHFIRAVELAPDDLDARRALAFTHNVRGDAAAAVAEYRRVLERAPDDVEALVNVARIRATHANPALRDGAEAVRCAERARAVAEPFSFLFGSLAAAYAESGRFEDAVAAAARAIELARAEGDAAAAARYEAQSAEYRAGRPYRAP